MHIYATSGKDVGLGHVIRCLSLSAEARKSGIKTFFYTNKRIKRLNDLFIEACDKFVEVPNINSYIEHIKSFPLTIDVAIVDDYSIIGSIQTKIKEYCKCLVVVADDFYSDYFNCSIVINPNPYKVFDQVKMDKNSIDCILEGCKYVSLKQSIINAKDVSNTKEHNENLLFLSGGTDSASIVESFLTNSILFEKKFDKIEIIGSIDKLSIASSNVSLIPFTNNIHKNIMNASIIVTPVGSTVWEAFYLEKIVIGFSVSDNQKKVFEYLKKNNLILPLDLERIDWIKKLIRCISDLRKNLVDRSSILEKTTKLIDGNGSKRILKKIFNGFLVE